VEFPAGEFAARFAADVNRERRSRGVEELFGMVIGKIIQRSGLSARSRRPISAATSRTCVTTALSSVSGMVKNCGACGSMAPPITVDIMAFLLCRKNILRGKPQQGDPYRRSAALALPMPASSRYYLQRDFDTAKI
jgi:hypothetical protein